MIFLFLIFNLSWYSWKKLSHILDYKLFYGYFEEFDPKTGYGNPVIPPKWLLANQVTAGKKWTVTVRVTSTEAISCEGVEDQFKFEFKLRKHSSKTLDESKKIWFWKKKQFFSSIFWIIIDKKMLHLKKCITEKWKWIYQNKILENQLNLPKHTELPNIPNFAAAGTHYNTWSYYERLN